MKKLIEKAAILTEALPYIQEFRGQIVVIKFGGSAMEDDFLTKSAMKDIVLLECIGMNPVVVHGGGKAISARLSELGIETKFINGLRYTCDKTINVVDEVLHNHINPNLTGAIGEAGGKGVRLSGKDFLKAEQIFTRCPKSGREIDIGKVGHVKDVDTARIIETLEQNIVPVIPPLALAGDGSILNINADLAACKIAEALKAAKLVFLSDVPGILRDKNDENSLISTVRISDVDKLIEDGTISDGMLPKISSAVAALESGTKKIHMIDGRIKHSLLLEIFTDEGIGTQIIR